MVFTSKSTVISGLCLLDTTDVLDHLKAAGTSQMDGQPMASTSTANGDTFFGTDLEWNDEQRHERESKMNTDDEDNELDGSSNAIQVVGNKTLCLILRLSLTLCLSTKVFTTAELRCDQV